MGRLFVGVEPAVAPAAETLFLVLGVSVAAFAAFNLINPRQRPLSPALERVVAPFAGALGGVLGGLTAIRGRP